MLRIVSHIERLLLFNDCVIIPGFGGFVLQIHPAIYVSEEHTFLPPYKDIVFNPTLKHNDGLLSESYMQQYNMDFNEAQSAITSDIDILKKELDINETLFLGRIGKFQKENSVLLFEPGKDISMFNIGSYGLISFYLPPVEDEESEESITADHVLADTNKIHVIDEEPQQVTSLHLNKILSSAAGVAAAAIAIFLLVSTPVKDVNRSAYTASFIPSEMVPKRFVTQGDLAGNEEGELENDADEDFTVMPAVTAPMIIPPLVLTIPEIQANSTPNETTADLASSSALKIEQVNSKTFYVIIASFATENELNKYMSKAVPSELKDMGVVKNNERIRVYANKTTDRKAAEEYMLHLRENEKYKDAWLFIGR